MVRYYWIVYRGYVHGQCLRDRRSAQSVACSTQLAVAVTRRVSGVEEGLLQCGNSSHQRGGSERVEVKIEGNV